MGCPTKVQLIKRKKSEQYYINFPAAIAQAMDFSKAEEVEWTISDKKHLILSRKIVPPDPVDLKKRFAPKLSGGTDGQEPRLFRLGGVLRAFAPAHA